METVAIQFHEITMEDKKWMDEKFAEDDRNACEYTFANNFIWRKTYHVEVAEICGCLVIRFQKNGSYAYSYPVGAGDKKAAITQLLLECKKEKRKLCMSPLLEADRKQLMNWFPGRFMLAEYRDDYDYIYSREKLATLAGKKLHGKRNHIARFKDAGDWHYEPMTEENLEDCRQMTYTWIKMRTEKWNEEMNEEVEVLHEAFDHKEELGLVGGVLYRENQIVAFTLGEPLNSDTFVVHFEKAYPDMQGAYPMINQQFVQHACEKYEYVNREEDTGDAGLRKAKLSYYPEILLKKYIATESSVVYADREQDAKQIKDIWMTCFGDSEEDVEFYREYRMTNNNMLVRHEDDKIVSMASFLPVQYLLKGEYVDAYYVYAVATLPEYRGRGYAAQILEFAKEWYKAPLILAPAEKSLVNYYEKIGFMPAFPGERLEIERETGTIRAMECESQECLMQIDETVSAAEYAQIRDSRLAGEGYVRWDEDAIHYAMNLNASCGGKTVAVICGDEENIPEETGDTEEKDVVMYHTQGKRLVIVETTLPQTKLEEILPVLFDGTGTCVAEVGPMSGMVWMPAHVEREIYRNGYLGLTLD